MNAGTTRFLVLLCTHNGETYLAQQLDSLLRQTTPVYALEVHDWGSSDATVAMLHETQRQHAEALDMAVTLQRTPRAPPPASCAR